MIASHTPWSPSSSSRFVARPCLACASSSFSDVVVKIARTPLDVEASARTCARAFARERSDGLECASTSFTSALAKKVNDVLDESYERAIARELTEMLLHHAEERARAKTRARACGFGEERARSRALVSTRNLTIIARFKRARARDEDTGLGKETIPTWIGSASVRVCAPEALFPEPFPTTKRVVPYVSNVAVDERARGEGVASALLIKCERATRMWGYRELFLHVDVGNVRTRAMYERRGYRACGEDPWWWGLGGILGARRVLLKKDVSRAPSSQNERDDVENSPKVYI